MNFDDFWKALQEGGKTRQEDSFRVVSEDGNERLHIVSSGNRNKRYFIRKDTVQRYFEQDLPQLGDQEFRSQRSAYFHNVLLHVLGQ